jgi:hypothetical protein
MGFPLGLAKSEVIPLVEDVAFYSLATYGHHAADIRDILLRMALSDGSLTTKAVMQSMLAVSSLHRFGPRPQATNLKLSALRTLAGSLATGISARGALQHIAAGMLLCTFEVAAPQQGYIFVALTILHRRNRLRIQADSGCGKRLPDDYVSSLVLSCS